YSSRYTPAATPSGTATPTVTSIRSSEPTQDERIPADAARREGNEVRNVQSIRVSPPTNRSARSATSGTTPTSVQTIPRTLKKRSCRRRRAINRAVSIMASIGLTEPLTQHVPHDVERQRHQEQRHPGGEDRLIPDAAARLVPQADLHDVSRDRRRRLRG